MFQRLISIPKTSSFFLFGARGTGKSTWLNLLKLEKVKYIDLLLPSLEAKYIRDPEILIKEISTTKPKVVIIDEIQKAPTYLQEER